MMPDRVLYHYTSGTGLMGIFEGRAVWASNIHQLNDSSEFRHALDLAKIEIAQLVSKSKDPHAAALGLWLTSLVDRCCKLSVYVACFSEIGDSLSQWRGYCPDAFGYSVGLDEEMLRSEAVRQGFTLSRCIYENSEKRSLLTAWAQSTMADLLPGFDPSHAAEDIDSAAWPRMQQLLRLAPFFKHPSFSEEREWRMAKVVDSRDPALRLRAGKSMLIRYLPVELGDLTTSEIVWDVCIGPTPHPDLAMDAVCHYFGKIRIKNGVRHSESPYRSW